MGWIFPSSNLLDLMERVMDQITAHLYFEVNQNVKHKGYVLLLNSNGLLHDKMKNFYVR